MPTTQPDSWNLPDLLRRVLETDFTVPTDPPFSDLTLALTRALGDPDPMLRDELALTVLATWIERGVYDDLLTVLGDGLVARLRTGLGESGTTSVFGRSFCALLLAECVARDTEVRILSDATVLEWGDRLRTWFVSERDLRGWVPGHGWAHAVAHGADALGVLATSPHLGPDELALVLEALTRRAALRAEQPMSAGEPDRLAAAVLTVLRRDLVELQTVETCLAPVVGAATVREDADHPEDDPYLGPSTAQAFLRALHLQLAIGPEPPTSSPELLVLLVGGLQVSNPHHLQPLGA